MAEHSISRGQVMRIIRATAGGYPDYGDGNMAVTAGVIDVTITHNATETETEAVNNFAGQACAVSPAPLASLSSITAAINFCAVDPCVVGIMYPGWNIVLDEAGVPIGYDVGPTLSCGETFFLEVWAQTGISAGAGRACGSNVPRCRSSSSGRTAYKYLVIGPLLPGAPADLSITEQGATFGFTGTSTSPNGWGRGPLPVMLVGGIPSQLITPIPEDTFYRIITTNVRPPQPTDGCVELPRPIPEPAELFVERDPTDTSGRTVRVRVDNHGFGPVQINFGDGTETVTVPDGGTAVHQYTADGEFTMTVNDQQTPAVVVTREIEVPLDDDRPTVTLSRDPADASGMTVTATIKVPRHSNRQVVINWGDDTDEIVANSDAEGNITATHRYDVAGIYPVTATRTDVCGYTGRSAVAVPIPVAPTVTSAVAGQVATLTINNNGQGLTSVDWGDGVITDGPATDGGEVQHTYAAAGTYTVQVYSKANPASRTTLTVTIAEGPPALPVPTGLTVGTPTSTTLPVSWTAAAGADTYRVRWAPTGTTTWTERPVVTVTNDTITGLTANTTYDVQVKSVGDGTTSSDSAWSPTVTGTTAAAPAPLPTPTGLTVGTPTTTTLPMTWDAASGATQYALRWAPTGTTTWTERPPVATTTDTIDALTANTGYDVQVKSVGNGTTTGDSSWSATVTGTTAAALTARSTRSKKSKK
jgi:Fibronectin type III domain